jgi:hypothetical protein
MYRRQSDSGGALSPEPEWRFDAAACYRARRLASTDSTVRDSTHDMLILIAIIGGSTLRSTTETPLMTVPLARPALRASAGPAAAHGGSGIVSTGLEQRVSSLALRDDPRRRRFAFPKPDTASHAHGNESCNQSDKNLFHLTSPNWKDGKHQQRRIVRAPGKSRVAPDYYPLKRSECCISATAETGCRSGCTSGAT